MVAPGSLVEQSQDELAEKFDLTFSVLTREGMDGAVGGNPFADHDRLILRLDMASRSPSLQAQLEAAPE